MFIQISDISSFRFFTRAALIAGALAVLPALPALSQTEKPPEIATPEAQGPITPQIVGGTEVSTPRWRSNFRWVVALVNSGNGAQFCGGSLINRQWVLTAAHCLPGLVPSQVSVRVATPVLSSGGRLVPVAGMVLHPDYDPVTFQNDIALLRLAEPVSLPTVARATVPVTDQLAAPGRRTIALGWGATSEGGQGSDRLREVSLPVVSPAVCRRAYPNETIFRTFLCAGFRAGGQDSCQGDSGGPLVVRNGQRWTQVGITSWGNGCARPAQYGVYTRLANFNGWVNSVLRGSANCIDRDLPQVIRRPGGFDCFTVPRNDDSAVGPVELGFEVRLGGQRFDSVFVNNNGNLTFGSSLSTYTPQPLVRAGLPIIAPFFADVDTRGENSGVVSYGQGMIGGRRAFAVVWQNVGYFQQGTDRLNSFQVVLTELTPESGNFRIEFNYGPVQWETGDASGGSGGLGGNSARAGFSLVPGNANRRVELPGSARPGALIDGGPSALSRGSNIGTPGRFAWTVRNGVAQR